MDLLGRLTYAGIAGSLVGVDSDSSKSTDPFSVVEANLFLQKFLSTLSDEEQTLCEMMKNGRPLHRMAYELGISLATVKRRWDDIRKKGRNALPS